MGLSQWLLYGLLVMLSALYGSPIYAQLSHSMPSTCSASGGSLPLTSVALPPSLADAKVDIRGLHLEVPTKLDMLQDVGFTAQVMVKSGIRTLLASDLQQKFPGGKFVGTLIGGTSPAGVEGSFVQGGLLVGALPTAGNYVIQGIKVLKADGQVALDTKDVIELKCLGQILVTNTEVKPMTLKEIEEAGIQLGAGNYDTKKFVMTLQVGSKEVKLGVPVATPIYNGLESPVGESVVGKLELPDLGQAGLPNFSIAVANIIPEKDPFSLSRPVLSHALRNNFKALIVIPGTIAYLHQFYSAKVMVLNTLPAGIPAGNPYKVTGLKATYRPLNLGEGDLVKFVPKSGDVVIAPNTLKVLNTKAGTQASDSVMGEETGVANFTLEAMKEGNHLLAFDVQGQFEGGNLPQPVPIQGKAITKVLVRNPTFSLMLVHPDVVRKGEPYVLEAKLTNTSDSLAQNVSLSIDKSRLGNATFESKPGYEQSQTVRELKRDETHTFKFHLIANRTGAVYGSYLYIEKGDMGFQLATGVGERNIKLTSDTLSLPENLKSLPEPLKEAMLKVLGQAYSVATKGVQGSDVFPIPLTVVTGQFSEFLSEEGVMLKMGVDRSRLWWDLWRQFNQHPDKGFAQLMHTTTAGAELRNALLATWPWVLGGGQMAGALPLYLKKFAAYGEGLGQWRLLAVQGADGGLQVEWGTLSKGGKRWRGANGDLVWGQDGDRRLFQVPAVGATGSLRLKNNGNSLQNVSLSLLGPAADGSVPLWHNLSLTLKPQEVVQLSLSGSNLVGNLRSINAKVAAINVPGEAVFPEPFQLLGSHRYDISLFSDASPYGTHVMALFNRSLMSLDCFMKADGQAGRCFDFEKAGRHVTLPGNQLWQKVMAPDQESGKIPPSPPAILRAYPRILSFYWEKPIGPSSEGLSSNTLALLNPAGEGWRDSRGGLLTGNAACPIVCGTIPGGAKVWGRVRKADGTPVEADITYWYYTKVTGAEVDLLTGIPFVDQEVETYYALVSNFKTDRSGSDAVGSYQLDYVPEPIGTALGPMMLQAKVKVNNRVESAFGEASVVGNGQLINMDLVLEGKGTVMGIVTDANGNPLEGVAVQVNQEQPTSSLTRGTGGGVFSATCISKKDGSYELKDIKTGVFSLRALKGLYGVALSGEIAKDGEVVRKNVILMGRTGTVEMALMDENNQPIKGERIRLGFPAGVIREATSSIKYVYPLEAKTNESGKVIFEQVPAGDIHGVAPCIVTHPVQAFWGKLSGGETLRGTLRLLPNGEGKVKVCVVKRVGGVERPVSGAFVSLGRTGNYEAVTGEDGFTQVLKVAANKPLSATAYHPTWKKEIQGGSVVPLANPPQPQVIKVAAPTMAGVRGRVLCQNLPVAGAYVAIPPVYDDSNRNYLVRTNAAGDFCLANFPHGENAITLRIVGPELKTAATVSVKLVADEVITLQTPIVLPPVGQNKIHGMVCQAAEGSNAPIPTIAAMTVMGQWPNIACTKEGNTEWGHLQSCLVGSALSLASPQSEGNYHFKDLPAGPLQVSAGNDLLPMVTKSLQLTGHQENVELNFELKPSFTGDLRGIVTRSDGQTPAPEGTRVRLLGEKIGEYAVVIGRNHPQQPDPKGRYTFAKVIPPGNYQLRAEDPQSGHIAVAPVSLDEETSQVCNLRLWGKGNLLVHAQNAAGEPLRECVITVTHSKYESKLLTKEDFPVLEQKIQLGSPNSDGFFEGLWEGDLIVMIKDPSGMQGRVTTAIPAGGGNVEVVVRLQPVGDVSGTVLLAKKGQEADQVVKAGRVDAYGPRGGNGEVWLGTSPITDGRFSLKGLPAGHVRLEAWDPGSRQMARVPVDIMEEKKKEITIRCLDKGKITLKVLDGKGNPATRVGLKVSYAGGPVDGFSTEATTASQDRRRRDGQTTPKGCADFYLPPGTYHVSATDPETLSTASLSFSRANGEGPLTFTLSLQSVRTLAVTMLPPVHDEQQSDINMMGWRLVTSPLLRSVQLDAGGQGTLELPCGGYTLSLLDATGHLRGEYQATVVHEGPEVQSLALRALAVGTVQAQVMTAGQGGKPVPGVSPALSGLKTWWLQTATTDANGIAWFPGVLQGRGGVWLGGYENAAVAIEKEGQTCPVTLKEVPTGAVQGAVKDALDQPVAYAKVTINGCLIATDEKGIYAMDRLPIRTPLVATAITPDGRAGQSKTFVLEAGSTKRIDISIAPLGVLVGTLRDPLRPTPLPMQVKVTGAGVEGDKKVDTDSHGAFRLSGLPAGVPLTLTVYMADQSTVALTQSFSIPGEGAIHEINADIDKLVHLTGKTLDATGKKIPMLVKCGGFKVVTTEDHPTFTFRYLKSGVPYTLFGCDDITQTQLGSLTVTLSGDKPQEEHDLKGSPRGTVKVRTLKGNEALPNQTVYLVGEGNTADPSQPPRQTVSNPEGMATFEQVLVGGVRVYGTLEGKPAMTIGQLTSSVPLALDLRGQDMTTLQGTVQRSSTANRWPADTKLVVLNRAYVLSPEGKLPDNTESLPCDKPLALKVQLPSGACFALGDVTPTKNAPTQINVVAPPFGSVRGIIKDADQEVLEAGVVTLLREGLPVIQTTTLGGAYHVDGLLADIGKLWTLQAKASLPRLDRGQITGIRLASDGDEVKQDLTLKGKASLVINTRNRKGEPVTGISVTVTSTASDAFFTFPALTQPTTKDASGQATATFLGLLPTSVKASAVIDGSTVSATLTLAEGNNTASLQPPPITTLVGKVKRANPDNPWPQGTHVKLLGKRVDVNADGSLTAGIQLETAQTSGTVSLYVPGSRVHCLYEYYVTITPNGNTDLSTTAPAFGTLQGLLKDEKGNPCGGCSVYCSGMGSCTTSSVGQFVFPHIPLRQYEVSATQGSLGACEYVTLRQDGEVITRDLTLQDITAVLPLNLQRGRGASNVYVRGSRAGNLTHYFALDGSSAFQNLEPNGRVWWMEKGRRLAFTRQEGDLLFTVIRTVAPDSFLLRDEVTVRNNGAASRQVQMKENYDIYYTDLYPFYAGDNDTGDQIGWMPSRYYSNVDCVLWGDGVASFKPQDLNYNNLFWPVWTLAPGQSMTLALAHAPYKNSETGWRKAGAKALWARMRQQAPEWTYGGEPSTWCNWGPFLPDKADPLPPWDAKLQVDMRDGAGQKPVNTINWTFYPKDLLAPTTSSNSTGATVFGNQAPTGGELCIELPGDGKALVKPFDAPPMGELRLPEAASLCVFTQDAKKQPRQASLYLTINKFVTLYGGSSGADGKGGPFLIRPGELQIRAEMYGVSNVVTTTDTLATTPGVLLDPVVLTFPALGSAKLTLTEEGKAHSTGYAGYLSRPGFNDRYASIKSDGVLVWPDLPLGEWALDMKNYQTTENSNNYPAKLPKLTFVVTADKVAEQAHDIKTGQVGVRVRNVQDKLVAGAGVTCYGSDGGRRTVYTTGTDVYALSGKLALGPVNVSVTDPESGLTATGTVTLTEQNRQQNIDLSFRQYAKSVTLTLQGLDGSPAKGYRFKWNESSYDTNSAGQYTFNKVGAGNYALKANNNNEWKPPFADTSFTVSPSDQGKDLTCPITVPMGQAQFKVTRDDKPLAGVTLKLPYGYSGDQQLTDPQGIATFSGVPLNLKMDVQGTFDGYTKTYSVTLPAHGQLIPLVWPEIAKVSLQLKRPNGAALETAGWRWKTEPAGLENINPVNTLTPVWTDLPLGKTVKITAEQDIKVYNTTYGVWRATLEVKPGETPLETPLILPAKASATFAFTNAKGEAMTGNLSSGGMSAFFQMETGPAEMVQSPPISTTFSGFDGATFPAVLVEGQYQFNFACGTWNYKQPGINMTITPQDDGKTLTVPVVLPWQKYPLATALRASDKQTPVPECQLLMGGGHWLGNMPELPDENSRVENAHVWAPQGQSIDFTAQTRLVKPDGWLQHCSFPLGTFALDKGLPPAFDLPLSVVHCRLTDTDGKDLEAFQAAYALTSVSSKNMTTQKGYGDLPQVMLDKRRWSVFLGCEQFGAERSSGEASAKAGWKEGDTLPLLVFDPCGLGKRVSAVIPAQGACNTYEQTIPPYVKLETASLKGDAPTGERQGLYLGVSRECPAVVRPHLAQWLKDREPGNQWRTPYDAEWCRIRCTPRGLEGWLYPQDEPLRALRLPKGAKVWLATSRLGEGGKYGLFSMGITSPYGVTIVPEGPETGVTLEAEPVKWDTWKPIVFTVDGQSTLPGNTRMKAWPADTPCNWEYGKARESLTQELPLGVPSVVEVLPYWLQQPHRVGSIRIVPEADKTYNIETQPVTPPPHQGDGLTKQQDTVEPAS